MSKIVGPFLVLVLLATAVLLTGFGLYSAIITLPAWVWAIPAAALFGGWVVDRMMFWGLNRKAQQTQTNELQKAWLEAMTKAKKEKPPHIPYPGDKLN